MSNDNDQKQLEQCLNEIIEQIKICLNEINKRKDPKSATNPTDEIRTNSQMNNDIYTFPIERTDDDLLDHLTTAIQAILTEFISMLSEICSNYLLDFLQDYHYDRQTKQFTTSLTVGELPTFQYELEGLREASHGYYAAFNGDLLRVQNFLKNFPMYKDKPGMWRTTLLYSAARNNFFDVVKYLVEEVHCSINAQNQVDVDFALKSSGTGYDAQAVLGSTALHAACFNKHLDIVKYLVEHGANYFMRNQACETPIENGIHHPEIRQFFQQNLVLNYSIDLPSELPTCPIEDDPKRPMRDGMWEYKPFLDWQWYKFPKDEADSLHQALSTGKEVQSEVHLRVSQGIYRVSMIEFVRSARNNEDSQKHMAWVRCRGSSVLNFDCLTVWQIMFTRYGDLKVESDDIPSLKIDHTPSPLKTGFKVHLHNWYICDTKTSAYLDESMNYRKKIIPIHFPSIANGLQLNLQEFTFSNRDKTILGCVRWIPKLASIDPSDGKLAEIDNYRLPVSIKPVLLTLERIKASLAMKKDAALMRGETEEIDVDEEYSDDFPAEIDADDDAMTPSRDEVRDRSD